MQSEQWDSISNTVNFNLEIETEKFGFLVPKNSKILDFGCGYGRNTDALYSLGYTNIQGIDSSKKMIDRGNSNFPHLPLSHNSKNTLPFKDGYFQSIIMCAVLTCIPNESSRNFMISELHRVLAPQGIIHIVEFCSETSKTFLSDIGVKMHYPSPDDFLESVAAFKTLDFKIKNTKTMSGRGANSLSFFGKKIT